MCVMSVKIALLAASGHGGVRKRCGQTGRGVTFRIEGLKHLVDRNPVAKKQTVRWREADAGRTKAFASAVCGDFGTRQGDLRLTSHEKETIVVRSYGVDVLSLRNSNWRWICKKRSEC